MSIVHFDSELIDRPLCTI